MNIGLPEIIGIIILVLLLFGAKRLPELARSVGKSTKAFKEGIKEGATDEDDAASSPTPEQKTS